MDLILVDMCSLYQPFQDFIKSNYKIWFIFCSWFSIIKREAHCYSPKIKHESSKSWQNRSKLSKDLKLNSGILSQLDYCYTVFCSLNESQIQILRKIKNDAVSFIFDWQSRDHDTSYLKELHFLPVKQTIVYKIAMHTFKCRHGIAPPYF